MPRDMRALAALVVHRPNFAVLALDEVDLGDEVQLLGRQLYRPRNPQVRCVVIRLGQCAALLVNPTVHMASFHGVRRTLPLLLHPLEIGETRAVDELVENPRRDERLVLSVPPCLPWLRSPF